MLLQINVVANYEMQSISLSRKLTRFVSSMSLTRTGQLQVK